MAAEPVFVHGSLVDCVGNRLKQTERALVVERLARQTAEVAQQTVGTWPAGIDAEEIGTLPMFSGDVDLSEQTDSVPWSQWSLTIRSDFGKFNRTTAWMLQQVEMSVDDPIITDNTVMTRAEKRFSAQAYCVLVLTCRGKALQVVQRVPRGFGFEAWKQLYEEFEPRPPVKSQEMCQALLSPAKSDESLQMARQQESGLNICGEQPGDEVSVLQPGRPMALDLFHQEVTECLRASQMCKMSDSTDPRELASFGEEEDDGFVKLKKYVGWWEAGHNENECRDLSAGVEEDLEASVRELCGGRGTGVLSHAAEQNACLLHEDGSDQSVHSCPSPTDGGGDDLENLAASSSLQAWFDTEVLEVRENDNLGAIATTEQRPKTTFRPDVQVEPSEEVPDNSESITSVDTRKVERKFAVRNVTELIVHNGQQADKSRKTRLNDVDGLIRGMRSAGKIERLLRSKRSFGEQWNQKGECVIPCDKPLCSFPTLSEQESGQTRQMDGGEIEVEEEKRVRAKRMPVLATDKEKHENESTHVASRSQCKTDD